MAVTKIEWTATRLPEGYAVNFGGELTSTLPGYTFNPWWGCMKVSRACKRCYAEYLSDHRMKNNLWGPNSTRRLFGKKHWDKPKQWNKLAESLGVRLKVFCASMADVFEDHPDVIEARKQLWTLIEETPHLDWLLLTKRPENILWMLPHEWVPSVAIQTDEKGKVTKAYVVEHAGATRIPANIWFGATTEDQATYDERVLHLMRVPAKVRFLSIEPQAGPIHLHFAPANDSYNDRRFGLNLHHRISWVINGGESGKEAEPSHPDWFRSVRDQCKRYGVPYFFKQWGEWAPSADYKGEGTPLLKNRERLDSNGKLHGVHGMMITPTPPNLVGMYKVGKKAAGRTLDGQGHNAMPNSFLTLKAPHPAWTSLSPA